MKYIKLFFSIIYCQLAGVIGGLAMIIQSNDWYFHLQKPVWTPASWVFGPVWITLYTLMGIALYLVWVKKGSVANYKKAVLVFNTELVLNAIWTPIFFGLQNISLAFINILVLLGFIVWTMVEFSKISRRAMYLLVPYLLWVCTATVLNYQIMVLN